MPSPFPGMNPYLMAYGPGGGSYPGYGYPGAMNPYMMTGAGYDDRGVIGLGEPPVISPGAAIANAVANACGVRVPYLPLSPDKVIAALHKEGGVA